ncbi:hypothetical protein [Azospirillum sp.]|uniref:hypothetical protein n=1 Tax=Azospirillum sp. TaxID=34012 RepID=UPI002D6BAC88|nr:hypothetical protein [Azospirillum sp.]HYF86170.1 hypothetical protein [Azospirillum sp.]
MNSDAQDQIPDDVRYQVSQYLSQRVADLSAPPRWRPAKFMFHDESDPKAVETIMMLDTKISFGSRAGRPFRPLTWVIGQEGTRRSDGQQTATRSLTTVGRQIGLLTLTPDAMILNNFIFEWVIKITQHPTLQVLIVLSNIMTTNGNADPYWAMLNAADWGTIAADVVRHRAAMLARDAEDPYVSQEIAEAVVALRRKKEQETEAVEAVSQEPVPPVLVVDNTSSFKSGMIRVTQRVAQMKSIQTFTPADANAWRLELDGYVRDGLLPERTVAGFKAWITRKVNRGARAGTGGV